MRTRKPQQTVQDVIDRKFHFGEMYKKFRPLFGSPDIPLNPFSDTSKFYEEMSELLRYLMSGPMTTEVRNGIPTWIWTMTAVHSFWTQGREVWSLSNEVTDCLATMDPPLGVSLYDLLPEGTEYLALSSSLRIRDHEITGIYYGKGLVRGYEQSRDATKAAGVPVKNADPDGVPVYAYAAAEDFDDTEWYFESLPTTWDEGKLLKPSLRKFAAPDSITTHMVSIDQEILRLLMNFLLLRKARVEAVRTAPPPPEPAPSSTSERLAKSASRKLKKRLQEAAQKEVDFWQNFVFFSLGTKVDPVSGPEKRSTSAAQREHEMAQHRVRPHWRKAHWHTYWVGPKGEQRREYRYVSDVLVNASQKPVVVTEVT